MHEKLIEFWNIVDGYRETYPDMRRGQIYMNSLHKINPYLYNLYSNSSWDCFYNDNLCQDFIIKLYRYYK